MDTFTIPTAGQMREDWVYINFQTHVALELRKNFCEGQVRIKLDDPYGADKNAIKAALARIVQELRDKGYTVEERNYVNGSSLLLKI